jgi:hypothetical protein
VNGRSWAAAGSGAGFWPVAQPTTIDTASSGTVRGPMEPKYLKHAL